MMSNQLDQPQRMASTRNTFVAETWKNTHVAREKAIMDGVPPIVSTRSSYAAGFRSCMIELIEANMKYNVSTVNDQNV